MSENSSWSSMDLKDAYGAIARGEDILSYFPRELAKGLRNTEDIAIAEISGRDSIAAALKLIMDGEVEEVLPIADNVPPQYGNLNDAFSTVFWLRREAEKYGAKVHDLVFIKEHELYNTLAAKYSKYIINRYGFYTPCMPCHLYFHTVRVPLAKALGGARIIGGERDSHDGRMKPSQVPLAIDYYKKAVDKLGGELVLPLRDIVNTNEIINFTYVEDPQLSCMFKGFYGDLPKNIKQDEEKLKRYFEEFALPLNIMLIEKLTTEGNVDITKLADDFVRNLPPKNDLNGHNKIC